MLAVILLFLLQCNFTWTNGDAGCNCTEVDEQFIRLHSDSSSSDMNSSDWRDNSSGRVEVCWKGEWRGVVLGSIRTTREMNTICEHLGFSEGEELSYIDEEALNPVFCWWDLEDRGPRNYNCSNATVSPFCAENHSTSFNHTTMIKCKTFSYFSPEVIALVVLVPLLLCVIAVGALVCIHFLRKIKQLNVIIHQLIYKQQRIKAGVDHVTFGDGSASNSMYAKPFKGSAGQESRAHAANEMIHEEPSAALAGPSQYSLLGHDKKYENIDMEEVQEAPQL